jgi:PhzF family phenazine biosynthesis protein
MPTYTYHLINVFAETTLSGNPLCVFEDARGLDDATMQALALQFNLSETTFLLPSESATRHMRIFTPAYEMGFAGHPTLGSAHVVGELLGASELTLQTGAGVVSVRAIGDRWTFQVPKREGALTRPSECSNATLAHALGIDARQIVGEPLYVNTGNEQFLIPLASRAAVMAVNPRVDLLKQHVRTVNDRYMAYVFAPDGDARIVARFFFPTATGMSEDPGTGSACANLGAYLKHTGHNTPFAITVDQGEKTGRRCALSLACDESGALFVGGRCVRLGTGSVQL